MHLDELIVQGRVGDRGEVKNSVEPFLSELLAPIQLRQIVSYEIAAITLEIFEIARAKIVDNRQTGVRKFFLKSEDEIGTDETGAAGDKQIEMRIGREHEGKRRLIK